MSEVETPAAGETPVLARLLDDLRGGEIGEARGFKLDAGRSHGSRWKKFPASCVFRDTCLLVPPMPFAGAATRCPDRSRRFDGEGVS